MMLRNKKLEELHQQFQKLSGKDSKPAEKRQSSKPVPKTTYTKPKSQRIIATSYDRIKPNPKTRKQQNNQAQQEQLSSEFSSNIQSFEVFSDQIIQKRNNKNTTSPKYQLGQNLNDFEFISQQNTNRTSPQNYIQQQINYLKIKNPSELLQKTILTLEKQEDANQQQDDPQEFSPYNLRSLNLNTKQSFQPGSSPKFFHEHVLKKIYFDKSFQQKLGKQKNELQINYVKDNINRASLNSKQSPQSVRELTTGRKSSTFNRNNIPEVKKKMLEEKQKILFSPQSNNKLELINYYAELLKKVENIKFNVTMLSLKIENQEDFFEIQEYNFKTCQFLVEIEENPIINENLNTIAKYWMLIRKLGDEDYILLKKIYNFYSTLKNNDYSFGLRQMLKMVKDFEFYQKIQRLNQHQLEILISKQLLKRKVIAFQDFVEILFSITKLAFSEELQNSQKIFKEFIDIFIRPQFKKLNQKLYELNIEKIKIFFGPYSPYENPTVQLFVQMDCLLKHVNCSQYANFQKIFTLYDKANIKIDDQNYISLQKFLKLCKDFSVIPTLCSFQQGIKLFRAFQKGDKEVIFFSGLIMILCCIAHIGSIFIVDISKIGSINQEEKENENGFLKKIENLFQILINANQEIAEDLMNVNLFAFRD